jgi:hypothetical protein
MIDEDDGCERKNDEEIHRLFEDFDGGEKDRSEGQTKDKCDQKQTIDCEKRKRLPLKLEQPKQQQTNKKSIHYYYY